MRIRRPRLLPLTACATVVFLIGPLVVVLLQSLAEGAVTNLVAEGPSAHWYSELFEAREEKDVSSRPGFGVTLFTVLLPVALMLLKALVDIFVTDDQAPVRQVLDVLGTPLIALLIAVVVAMFTFGRGAGMGRAELSKSLESSLPAIAGILLTVAAGGGFK